VDAPRAAKSTKTAPKILGIAGSLYLRPYLSYFTAGN
jgi:hypothetical protein